MAQNLEPIKTHGQWPKWPKLYIYKTKIRNSNLPELKNCHDSSDMTHRVNMTHHDCDLSNKIDEI